MGIEIKGNSGRPAQEALEAAKSQAAAPAKNQPRAGGAARPSAGGSDQLQLSNQAAQLQALEAQIANLPIVDTQRVQDVQRTLATGSFQIEPAQVADKLLTFEVGLDQA